MQTEEILSAGIDIGTSTTQLVFSRMILQNTGGFGRIPQIKVVSKEVIYESEIYFTPLSSREEIDGERVHEIIKKEYEKAGVCPADLATGAVIITGETSRKRNAESVVRAIADVAGEFVVATAGADLESVLAGKGAGAADLSRKTGKRVVNLDIGGGTTNICVFEDGNMVDTACLDIGGRLIRVKDGRVIYMAPKLQWLCGRLEIDLAEGGTAETGKAAQTHRCDGGTSCGGSASGAGGSRAFLHADQPSSGGWHAARYCDVLRWGGGMLRGRGGSVPLWGHRNPFGAGDPEERSVSPGGSDGCAGNHAGDGDRRGKLQHEHFRKYD